MFNSKKFGEAVRFLRKKKGLTLLEYSMELNISEVYLGQIERGERIPSVELAIIILNAINMSFEDTYSLFDFEKNYIDKDLKNKIQLLNKKESKYLYNLLTHYVRKDD